MNEQQRRELVEKPPNFYRFKRHHATVTGYENKEASVSISSAGFYLATWEEIQRAADADGVIKNAFLICGKWLGHEPAENEEATG